MSAVTSKLHRLALLGTVIAALAAVGVTAVAAGTQPSGPEIRAVNPTPVADDAEPPMAPAGKTGADDDVDLPRDGTAPEPHSGHDNPDDGASTVDWATDPDAWVCTGPDDVGHARIIALPSLEILEAMRDYAVEQRAADPAWMPTVEYVAAPVGCEPVDGKPSLEDFYRRRTVLAVLDTDGSIKSVQELTNEENGS